MARASQVTSGSIEIPHEPGQWMRFRLVPYAVLAEARAKKMEDGIRLAKVLDGIKLDLAEIQKAATAASVDDDPAARYDRATLLRAGIAAWSYEGAVDGDDLDERTAEWAAREIVRLAFPTEKDLGKGSSPSTGTSPTPAGTPESRTS